jgi:hypothetical protein
MKPIVVKAIGMLSLLALSGCSEISENWRYSREAEKMARKAQWNKQAFSRDQIEEYANKSHYGTHCWHEQEDSIMDFNQDGTFDAYVHCNDGAVLYQPIKVIKQEGLPDSEGPFYDIGKRGIYVKR